MKISLKDIFAGVVIGGVALSGAIGCTSAGAQTHKVAKPETVVRAIGVYEWTGDATKPAGSRLVPVTLFIDGKLEDAGAYLARPIPMALLNGNVYELQQAGVGKGTLDLAYAKHLTTLNEAYDDGWFGYGAYKSQAPAKKAPALRQSKTLATVTSGNADKPQFSNAGGGGKSDSSASTGDPDRPTMKRRTDGSASGTSSGSSTASSTPADDPDRPTMKKPTGSDTASTTSDSSAPATDPDRPTMQRRTDDSGSGTGSAGNSTGGTGSASADDPDRPTLKRRSPEEAKKAQKEANMSSVTGVGSLNDDPNRPTMHRGKPVSAMTAEDLPPLKGLPLDLHQMVAVSDAADRPQHDFARPWENDQERSAVLGKMQTIARAQLAGYGGAAAAASAAPVLKKTPVVSTARSAKKPNSPPPVEPLLDEDLRGYLLSYGGAPTYVYQAHTGGDGAALRYVTVVAQADGVGELQTALKNVTDAAHLDRTPRMRMVDVVDVEASNRASLLFELRAQSSRQFAVYRVIGARSELTFLTGTTQ
jgi:hypothetical protein